MSENSNGNNKGGEDARRYEVKMDNLNSKNNNNNDNSSWSKSQEVGMEQHREEEEEDYYPPQNQNQNYQQQSQPQQQQQSYYPSSPSQPQQQQQPRQYYQPNSRPSYDRAQDSYDSNNANSRGLGEGRAHYSGNGQGPQGTGLPYRPLREESDNDTRGYNASSGDRSWNAGGGYNAQ